MKQVLTIAGSDSGSGAGIQADLKTFLGHGVYGLNVITALTAQNTREIKDIVPVEPSFVRLQLDALYEDFQIEAVKIGMIPNRKVGQVIAQWLEEVQIPNIVIDPVMIATCKKELLKADEANGVFEAIFSQAELITPNLEEAEFLSRGKIVDYKDMEEAAKIIAAKFDCNVLIKGGHMERTASDCLLWNNQPYWFHEERVHCDNNHGTGCTLSSSIAANLALGKNLFDSVYDAKKYLTGLLKNSIDIGKGNGPLNHSVAI